MLLRDGSAKVVTLSHLMIAPGEMVSSNVFENFRRPCLASAVLLASLPTPAEFPFDLS